MYFSISKTSTALAMACLLCFSTANAQEGGPPPPLVEIALAEERMLAPEMEVSGTVISLNNSRIAAEVEGVLLWSAQVGTAIKKGDILARTEDRLLKIAVRRAEANAASLKADMVFREADVARFGELAESNNASKARLQEVITRREIVRQNILEAEAMLERARGDLDRTNIRAPFSGHVAERLAATGEYLSVGADVVRLVDTENIEITMAAPIAVMPYLQTSNKITVESGDTVQELPIRTIVPVGNSVSRMVEVRLSADAANWVIGAPVKVTLPKGEAARRVAVPRDALILQGRRAYVFKVGPDMKALQVAVNVQTAVGLWVGIGGGIEAGDKIIVRGGERLTPGQSVTIKDE